MKKMRQILGVTFFAFGLAGVPALAADYGAMQTAELAALRGTMQQASAEERAAFQQEWQNRQQQMSAEERRQYSGQPTAASGDGNGIQTQTRTRSRQGGGNGKGMGRGGNR